MNLKVSIAAAIVGLVAGVGCSSGTNDTSKISNGEVTTTTAAPAASAMPTIKAAFDAQAYCVKKLTALAVKYPKILGDSDLAVECKKMISDTDASAAKTIDVLLDTAETYYNGARPSATLDNSNATECEAYAAKQTRLNPNGPAWTSRMNGTTCTVTQG